MNLLSTLLIASLALASACTYEQCDHQDNGSCGTACCRLGFYIQGEDTVTVMNKMNETINAGGPDGRYISMMTAEGTLTFGDLRPYDKPVDFIGQAWHTTTNLMYNDTMNFLIKAEDDGASSVVYAFSISQLAGSYNDEGQNYFNIVQLMESIQWSSKTFMTHLDSSCPAPKN